VLVAPLARLGWAEEDQEFMPRETVWTEIGLALYPHPADPEAIRIIVQYLGQRQVTERESAHGAALQAQLTF
jgi:hypothetical protein